MQPCSYTTLFIPADSKFRCSYDNQNKMRLSHERHIVSHFLGGFFLLYHLKVHERCGYLGEQDARGCRTAKKISLLSKFLLY